MRTEKRRNDLSSHAGAHRERVSAIGMGGYHIGKPELAERDAIQLIRQGIDRGITFLDNCWDYNDGASEVCGWARRWLMDIGTKCS